MPRVVKAKLEFEGRYFEQPAVIEEEDERLGDWPEGTEFSLVGRPAPRADGPRRVSGSARYTVDVTLPGMLHAAVLRSPVAHARVTNVDLEAARRAPGVRAVLGPDDETGEGAAQLSAEPEFVGQAIAAVAADTPEQAEAALAAFALAYEELPFYVDLEASLNEQRFTQDPDEEVRGDPEAALRSAEVRVDLELETPAQLQTPLETHAAVAEWRDDELTVWVSTQSIFSVREELSKRFSLPKERVRVVAEFVGGGFGSKLGAGAESVLAAELSRRARRPVRLVFSRHEEQLATGNRASARQVVRLGARRDGTLTAIEVDHVIAMGSGGMVPPFRTVAMTMYAAESAQSNVFPVRLNLSAIKAFRAPGVMEATSAIEQAMDELALKLELDPLELRRRAHVDHDQRSGKPYSSKALLACYDRAAELAGWSGRDALRSRNGDGLLRGLGCASQIWFGGGGPPAHCTIRIGSDGVATVTTGIQDIGTGTLTTAQIVAAEELGLPLERVLVLGGDTRPNIYGPAAGGSATTGSAMPAIRAAAIKVRQKLLQVAGDLFEAAPDDLELVDGRIRSRDRALDRPFTDVTDELGFATIEGSGARLLNPEDTIANTFGCQIAQVAVDPGLGIVRVERIVAVHDVGRIINPLTASSQVEGGVIQGMAYALMEERVVDPTIGAPVNATLDDYKVPTIMDTPEIVVDFVEVPDVHHVATGAKGLGEPPVIPTAAAIANAFAHATGRRALALPLTPDRVLATLSGRY